MTISHIVCPFAPRSPSWRSPRLRRRPRRRPRPRSKRRSKAALREVPEPQGRQERRLHPGARQGRLEHLRHRAGDGRRQGLHRGRHQVRGVDPVDLEGLHDGAGDGGVGRGRHRRQHGRRRHRPGVQLDRRRRAVQGRRDEPDGQPGRDHGDQHGARARPATRSGRRSSTFHSDFAGRPLSVNQEVFKSEADTNQRNQAIAMLMFAYGHIKAEPAAGDRHLHRAVRDQRQRAATSR